MKCYIAAVFLLLRSSLGAFSVLQPPANLTVDSFNFEHILKWDPGPRTPPGTLYWVNI
ncbi:interferon lambda receptor 1-like, partial [Arapaima gigas]